MLTQSLQMEGETETGKGALLSRPYNQKYGRIGAVIGSIVIN